MREGTPKGFRLHIAIFGRRNVGKSSLLNALTGQEVSIVSEQAGTTTDPVEKAMELLPLGPVLFVDTAGIDDVGALGEKRIKKTQAIFDRADLGIIVSEANCWTEFEEGILKELQARSLPSLVAFNKIDLASPDSSLIQRFESEKIPFVLTSALNGQGINDLKEALIKNAPEGFFQSQTIMGDLISPGELVVLVVPIDKEAPRGRLILPQVQTIRDILDYNAYCVVVNLSLIHISEPTRPY